MPELPEVETIRRGIAPHLLGQRIVKIVVRQPRLRWPVPIELTTAAVGKTIQQVDRRGKYLLLRVDVGVVIVHLGMSGRLQISPADRPLMKHDHVDFILADGRCLRFNDSRRFGAVLWTAEPIEQHILLRGLGPEPFDEAFSGSYLYQRAQGRVLAIKSLIMDNRVVVGVGNIYANESLFRANIHPLRPAGQLSLSQCERLTWAIQDVLEEAIRQGGTTLRDFVSGEGAPGYFQHYLQVYARQALACTACGTPIQQCRLGQRTTYFCPNCQHQ